MNTLIILTVPLVCASDCSIGVRQGCVLSPTLFSMFINRLADHMAESGKHGVQMLPGLLELFILLFADDVALISMSPVGLQNQLNVLQQFCQESKLQVNISKTKVMVFRKGGILGKGEVWHYENVRLEVVKEYCYLGFIFTPMASPKIGIKHMVKKAKKALISFIKVFYNYNEMSQELYFKIFDVKIKSILMYACEIWGLNRLDNLERIHLLAIKTFLGVPIQTPNKMVYGDSGRYPLYIDTNIRAVKYWLKLLKMKEDRLPCQAYHMLQDLDSRGGNTWVTMIRKLLSLSGFNYVWIFQGVGNENMFLRVLKERLIDIYKTEWNEALLKSDRHSEYSKFKHLLEKEQYIVDIDKYYFRKTMSKLRFNMLPLNNNLHRYGARFEDKLCPFCLNIQEDEKHFLFYCPVYAEIREKFLSSIVCEPLHLFLSHSNRGKNRQLASFVVHALKMRKNLLGK
jgi:hypothetical protein